MRAHGFEDHGVRGDANHVVPSLREVRRDDAPDPAAPHDEKAARHLASLSRGADTR